VLRHSLFLKLNCIQVHIVEDAHLPLTQEGNKHYSLKHFVLSLLNWRLETTEVMVLTFVVMCVTTEVKQTS
jgi:hypothetical protein